MSLTPLTKEAVFRTFKPHLEAVTFFSSNETEIVNQSTAVEQVAITVCLDDVATETPNTLHYNRPASTPSTQNQNDVLNHLAEWVRHKNKPYCALLGEYGMGKTMTCMRFTQWLLTNHLTDPSLPLPIYLDLRYLGNDLHQHDMDLISIIQIILRHSPYTHHDSISLTAGEVIRLVREEGALVIFDGLDEILVHLSSTKGQQFTHQLLSILSSPHHHANYSIQGQLLITCRTHYFRTIRDQKALFANSSHCNITSNDYLVLVLLPFSQPQIYDYLMQQIPHMDQNRLMELMHSVHNLSELAKRPYTLSLIPGLIPYIEQWKNEEIRITGVIIYRHIILSWLERDSGKHKLTTDHKQQLMEHFAAELWRSGQQFWNITNIEDWFIRFIHARPSMAAHYVLGQDENTLFFVLETLKEDLRTATFLVRIGESDFCFAHTSLKEFFLATYLFRALMENRPEDWDMHVVSHETLDFLGQLLSEEDCPEAIATLCELRDTYRPRISEMAFAYMTFAHLQQYPAPECSGFRLEGAQLQEWTILGHSTSGPTSKQLLDLSKVSFRHANLNQANLNYINLNNADFTDAQLDSTEFMYDDISNAIFKRASLKNSLLRNTYCKNTDFSDAQIDGTTWIGCNFEGARGLSLHHPTAFYSICEPSDLFHSDAANTHHSQRRLPIIDCVTFSPDGQSLISACWDNTVKHWDIETGNCLKVLSGHTGWVRSCAISPDGQTIVSASEDTTLRLWNSTTGQCTQILQGHTMMARGCAFSPDGSKIISASWDKTVRLWDTTTGECLSVMQKHSQGVNNCAYAPNGQHIASVSDEGTLIIWNPATGKHRHILSGHQGMVRTCAYSPDSTYLVSGSVDKTLRIWNVLTGECQHILKGHKGRLRSCAFSPDGQYIVSASEDKTLRVWSAITGDCLNIFQDNNDKVRTCTYSPDGKIIASAGNEPVIRLRNATTGALIKTLQTDIKY